MHKIETENVETAEHLGALVCPLFKEGSHLDVCDDHVVADVALPIWRDALETTVMRSAWRVINKHTNIEYVLVEVSRTRKR